jgi:hypothetical protein
MDEKQFTGVDNQKFTIINANGMCKIDSDTLAKHLKSRLDDMAMDDELGARQVLGDHMDGIVVVKEYRGDWEPTRDLGDVLSDFADVVADKIVDELADLEQAEL